MSRPVEFGEVIAALQARTRDVAEAYAPGGYIDGGRYWALNPGRADRHIGSFYVGLQGAYAGRWRDEATKTGGDMLDLIQIALGCDRRGALDEAKQFLGLANETAAQRDLRKRQAERAAAQREADAQRLADDLVRKRAHAQALFLNCHARLADTPVEFYLRARAIGIERLGRVPNAIRFHPALPYKHIDKETGEIVEGVFPAMVTAIHGPFRADGPAEFWGVHRTWLAQERSGRWWKAPVPKPKKVLGQKKGGYIRLWSGYGPRGGKGVGLSHAGPGAHVYLTEGIEDGLSAAVLAPQGRVVAAVDLGNMSEIMLPPAVTQVTIIRDNDPDPDVRKLADKAHDRFIREGRSVREWSNHHGGKDLNAALMAASDLEDAG